MTIEQLGEAKERHFVPSGSYSNTLLIGQKFLSGMYFPDDSREATTKREYGETLKQAIRNQNVPFYNLKITQPAFSEATTALKRRVDTRTACRCVSDVMESEVIQIVSMDENEFLTACERFKNWNDQDGSFTDFVNGTYAMEKSIDYMATWDGHHQPFDITLLPLNHW